VRHGSSRVSRPQRGAGIRDRAPFPPIPADRAESSRIRMLGRAWSVRTLCGMGRRQARPGPPVRVSRRRAEGGRLWRPPASQAPPPPAPLIFIQGDSAAQIVGSLAVTGQPLQLERRAARCCPLLPAPYAGTPRTSADTARLGVTEGTRTPDLQGHNLGVAALGGANGHTFGSRDLRADTIIDRDRRRSATVSDGCVVAAQLPSLRGNDDDEGDVSAHPASAQQTAAQRSGASRILGVCKQWLPT
jgi:hypothetical protein